MVTQNRTRYFPRGPTVTELAGLARVHKGAQFSLCSCPFTQFQKNVARFYTQFPTLMSACVWGVCTPPTSNPLILAECPTIELNSTLSIWRQGRIPQVKGSVLHFRCQSSAQVVTCASDLLTISRRFPCLPL